MTEDTFKAALEEHRKNHENPWSLDAQSDLRNLHLQRAAALEEAADAAAIAHLRAAEDCEWRVHADSTSAGDIAAALGRVYEIRARRARMHERLGEAAVALDLWQSIAADPNGLGKFAAPEVARLEGS